MANTEITGLFSAGDLASAENQDMRNRAMEKAKLTVGDAGAYTASLGSGMLIEGLAEMAGMKTRAQKKQEDVQNILSKYATADQNDPKTLFSLAQDFTQKGHLGLANQFAARARELHLDTYKADTDRINALSSGSSTDPGTFRKSLNTAALILGCDLENDADCKKEAYALVLDYKRENRWDSGSADALVDDMVAVQAEGAKTGGEIAKINQMLEILPEIYTGWGAGAWEKANRVGALFNLPEATKEAGQMEIFAQGGMEAALKYISQTKGAISDREFEAFLASAPGLYRTKAGNELMLNTALKYAEFNQKKAIEQNRWIKEQRDAGKTPLLEDWSSHLAEWAAKPENIIKLPTEAAMQEAAKQISSSDEDVQTQESVDEMIDEINRMEAQ